MKKVFILATLLLSAAAVSCNKEPQVEDSVTVKTEAATLPVEGGVVSIAIEASTSWTAKSSESWLTLSPASGEAGEATIKASALKNETNDARTADVVITAGKAQGTYTVTQSQLNALEVQAAEYTVGYEGGVVEIPVLANVEYTVSIPEAVDWISETKAMTESKVVLNVAATQLYVMDDEGGIDEEAIVRSAKITISGNGVQQVVTVGQKTFTPYFEYEGEWADLQWSFYSGSPVIIPQEGAEIVIDVATNIEWVAYFSVWDNDLGGMVDSWDIGWAKLAYDVEKSVITLSVAPNESNLPRENHLYSVGYIDGKEDGSFGGLGWFRQEGIPITGAEVTLVWQQSLEELGIPAAYNRLAWLNGELLVSDGEKVHTVHPADGAYGKAVTYPGVVPSSIASDDAGHLLVVPDVDAEMDWGTYELISGTEIIAYYTDDVNTLKNSMKLVNKDYGTVGAIRARGDLAGKGVITGVAGGAHCWFGYDVNKYEASDQYQGSLPYDGNPISKPTSGATLSLNAASLEGGVLVRAYSGDEYVYYLADAYTPSWLVPYDWKLLSEAGEGGNENQNNMDIVEYKGRQILAFTQGYHFFWSANAMIFVLDVTDVDDVKTLAMVDASEWVLDGDWSGSVSADILLHPADDCLELYAVQSGQNTLAKFKVEM